VIGRRIPNRQPSFNLVIPVVGKVPFNLRVQYEKYQTILENVKNNYKDKTPEQKNADKEFVDQRINTSQKADDRLFIRSYFNPLRERLLKWFEANP
jgi:hypothetical protein